MAETFCVDTFTSSVSINKEATIPTHSTGCNVTKTQLQGELSMQTKSILATVYLIAVIMGTLGNLLAVFTVSLNKRMQTTGNLLLLNLSISDLIVTMICMPVILGYQILSYPNWPHSESLCKASKFLVQISVFCSISTLISISIHRCFILYTPFHSRFQCIKARHALLFTVYWIFACVFTIPTWTATKLALISSKSTIKLLCIEVYENQEQELIFLSLRLATYFSAVLILGGLHTWIATRLRTNRDMNIDEGRLQEIKTAVKLLLVATVAFTICWLPYAIYLLLAISKPNGYELRKGFDIFANCLGMANSVLDPYIYCYCSKSFRTGFKNILDCIRRFLFRCKTQTVQPVT